MKGMNSMTTLLEKPEATEELLREISRTVTDAVDDGVRTIVRALKQGREAADDAIRDVRYTIRQRPLQSMGILFALGVVTGALTAWIGSRRY